MSKQNNENFSDWKFSSFATGINDTDGAPWAANISASLEKIQNGLNRIVKGLDETGS